MIQVCDPPRQRQIRRLSAEEFFTLVRCGGVVFYRPCSEVLRMLTVGEVWGVYSTRGVPGAGCILLPMDADVAAAAALRRFFASPPAALPPKARPVRPPDPSCNSFFCPLSVRFLNFLRFSLEFSPLFCIFPCNPRIIRL